MGIAHCVVVPVLHIFHIPRIFMSFGRIENMSTLPHVSNNANLYVAFHVPPEESKSTARIQLERTLQHLFSATTFRLINSEKDHGQELVYSIEKPLFTHEEVQRTFFESLVSLFSTTSYLTPHFTQFVGDHKGASNV